jgi:amino acid transporter
MMDAFKAVFWSFLGVRKKSEYEADARRLTPQAVIAAGLVAALLFVLALYALVQVVTR